MDNFYDLIIIGAGPAGLTAGIYMARAKYKTLILEKDKIGGQITLTEEVVNYPSIAKISGEQLTSQIAQQALQFGATIKKEEVISIKLDEDIKEVQTTSTTYKALSIIVATGAKPRKLGFKGEDTYQGRGIAYCATCDGEFFKDKHVFVVGGGFAAAEEAMYLTRLAKSVTMIVREPEMTCAQTIIDKVKNHTPKITIHYHTEIESVEGNEHPTKITFKNNQTHETWSYEDKEDIFGIFIFAGYIPNTQLIKDKVQLDNFGYVLTDENKQTNIPGVFAAGDLCVKNLRQVVTATSDGAIAATSSEKVVNHLHEKLNLPSFVLTTKETVQTKQPEVTGDQQFITADMIPQLNTLFEQLLTSVEIQIHYHPSHTLKDELLTFSKEIGNIHPNVTSNTYDDLSSEQTPYITFVSNKKTANYRFYGIPGGHEFTAFVVTIHRLYAPQRTLSQDSKEKLLSINEPIQLDAVISLSCTKCPGLVMALAHLLSYSENIQLNIFDITYAESLREQYKIMSVPCLIINRDKVTFGQKSAEEIIELL